MSKLPVVPVPRTLAELMSPDWLSSALGARFPGVRVVGVTPGPVASRVSTIARFRIECAGELPGGLSPDLCAKGYFTEEGWPGRRVGAIEVAFYRDMADRSGIRTPGIVYGDIDPDTEHGVIITEDVVAQGSSFLDASHAYTVEQTAESLDQLAGLHAATWRDGTLVGAPWLRSRLAGHVVHRGVAEIDANFGCAIGAGVPESVRDAERLVAAYRALIAHTVDAAQWSVIHGDAHIGNMYLDPAGLPSFVDWQLVQLGPWYLDVGYHIASTLPTEQRRAAERDLLRHYLDRLAAAGIDPPSPDEAWLGLRRGVVHGFYLWGITQKVDPALTTIALQRLGTAAADHDSYTLLGV